MGITGIILAGGKSTRMGCDKGLIDIHGKEMIAHLMDHIKPLCDQLLISANSAGYHKFGYPVIPDIIADIGPAGGLISCLPLARNQKSIVVSCDLPFVSKSFLRQLLTLSAEFEITIPRYRTWLQPLCGIYRNNIHAQMKDLVVKGHYSMQDLVRQFHMQVVEEEQLPGIDMGYELHNINSPEDLKNLDL